MSRVTLTMLRGVGEAFPPSAPDLDPLSEAGAAERFTRLHGADVRYDHRRGRWLLWQGHRWAPDTDGAIIRLGLAFARQWQHDALDLGDREARQRASAFAFRLERSGMLENVLTLSRNLKPIATAGDAWDTDPWLLGLGNGVLELRTGDLRPGRREDLVTMQAGVPFDPAATCPRWTRFLSEIFGGDAALIDFLQRAAGYALTGITSEQFLIICYGTGSNGKGTLLNALAFVLGDYGHNMPFSTVELRQRSAIPNDLAALVGRRFIVASETNEGTRLNESRIKMLTGCDPVTARFLHSEYFTFPPVGKIWLAVNHKPTVRDDSFAFWRRVRLIPFLQTFAVNGSLSDDLKAEGKGIMRWALKGCLAWQRDGFAVPSAVVQATGEYQTDSDLLAEFFEVATAADPDGETRATDLFAHYRAWCDRQHLSERERLTSTAFGRKCAEHLRRVKTRQGWAYLGVVTRNV